MEGSPPPPTVAARWPRAQHQKGVQAAVGSQQEDRDLGLQPQEAGYISKCKVLSPGAQRQIPSPAETLERNAVLPSAGFSLRQTKGVPRQASCAQMCNTQKPGHSNRAPFKAVRVVVMPSYNRKPHPGAAG